jgi:hypothetical protein
MEGNLRARLAAIASAMLMVLSVAIPGREPVDQEGADGCTSVLVTKAASADGSVMTTHSCDGHYEFRLHWVPGKKNKPGTMMPV